MKLVAAARFVLQAPRLAEAAILLAGTSALLLVSPGSGGALLLKKIRAQRGSTATNGVAGMVPGNVARAVARVAPLIGGTTCLSRAFTGWVMLKRRGIPSVVRVGARREPGGDVAMHAWLEVDDAPLIGSEAASVYVALSRPQ